MDRQSQPLWVALEWIPRHCIVPDGFKRGRPFRPYDYQFQYLASFYTVRADVEFDPEAPKLAAAFVYRRGILVGPQKVGKNPMIAAQICLEGVGPSLFAGWAEGGEQYRCRDWGCACGWVYAYKPGEPMGMPRPTPLIEITAYSEDSTDNTYLALRPMIDQGPLHGLITHTGEAFMRLPDLYGQAADLDQSCRINTVTSSPGSRLGGRVTFAPQDEVGIWTPSNGMTKLASTQYRNLAGMGGRASLTTNAWDPAQKSVGQVEYESAAKDVYRQFLQPPKGLSFGNKHERRKIFTIVYPPDTRQDAKPIPGHVDLESIESEAADLFTKDPAEAARFFGNMLVPGSGKAFDVERWQQLVRAFPPLGPESIITLGFDGSRYHDATGIIATDVVSGFQWVLGVWERQPGDPPDWKVPRGQVGDAVRAAFESFRVWRMYADPAGWDTELGEWAGEFGAERIVSTPTNRWSWMARVISAFAAAITLGTLTHAADPDYERHIGNAHRFVLGIRDEEGHPLYVITKERDDSPNKIDLDVAGSLSWRARLDALALGLGEETAWTAA